VERVAAERSQFLYRRHGRQPETALDGESLWREPERAGQTRQAVLLRRFRANEDRPADRQHGHAALDGFPELRSRTIAKGGSGHGVGNGLPRRPALVPFYTKIFSLYPNTAGTALPVLGCPFNSDGGVAAGYPPNGNGCAIRHTTSQSSADHEQVITARADQNIDIDNMVWYRLQSDTGLQAAYTDPINPLFNSISSQPLYSFAAGYTHIFSQNLLNYFNPAFSWYESLFGPADLAKTLGAFPIVLEGAGSNAPFTTLGGLDYNWVQEGGRRGSKSTTTWRGRRARTSSSSGSARGGCASTTTISATMSRRWSNTQPWRSSFTGGIDGDQSFPGGRLATIQLSQPGPVRAGHRESDVGADLDDGCAHGNQYEPGERARPDCAAARLIRRREPQPGSAPEPGAGDGFEGRLFIDAAGYVAAPDGGGLAICAADGCARRIRRVQRSAAGEHRGPDRLQSPVHQHVPGRSAGPAGGLAIAPGVPASAVDATIAANQAFLNGFRQGQRSCASASANPATCLAPVALTAIPDGRLRAPYFMQWSFGMEHQMGIREAYARSTSARVR